MATAFVQRDAADPVAAADRVPPHDEAAGDAIVNLRRVSETNNPYQGHATLAGADEAMPAVPASIAI